MLDWFPAEAETIPKQGSRVLTTKRTCLQFDCIEVNFTKQIFCSMFQALEYLCIFAPLQAQHLQNVALLHKKSMNIVSDLQFVDECSITSVIDSVFIFFSPRFSQHLVGIAGHFIQFPEVSELKKKIKKK